MNEKVLASQPQNGRLSRENGRGCSRAEFLQRVRGALAVPGELDSAGEARRDLSLVRLVGGDADCVGLFIERATAGGLCVHRVKPNDLMKVVVQMLSACGARRVAVSVPGRVGQSLREWLAPRGVAIVSIEIDGSLDAQYDADVGITDCDAGLAESGTIVLRGDAERSRGTFIVPPIHLAILRESQILPDMLDYWPTLSDCDGIASGRDGSVHGVTNRVRKVPTSIVMISGPSKTADIEGILITGVHGPREVHVVLVDDR